MHCPCCGAPPHGAGDVLAFQDPISRDAAAVAEHLDLKNAVHIGHSTGGGEVTRYVAQSKPGTLSHARRCSSGAEGSYCSVT